jgi:6-phospho-beta-glucosidase
MIKSGENMKNTLKIAIIAHEYSYLVELLNKLEEIENKPYKVMISIYDDELLINKFSSDLDLSYEKNLIDVIKNADFICMNYIPGGNSFIDKENSIFTKYNIDKQSKDHLSSVFSAVKAIPFIYELIDLIKKHATHAWLINSTKSLGITSEAIFRYSDFENYIGVNGVQALSINHFSKLIQMDKKKFIAKFVGPSDLSFMTSFTFKKKNYLNELMQAYTQTYDDWTLDLLKTMKAMPQDNHHAYYMKNHHNEALVPENKDIAASTVSIISSMINDSRDYQVVTTINDGHVLDLYHGCAIEITSRITKDGPMPIFVGRLPVQIRGFVQYIKSSEEHISDAIYAKSLDQVKHVIALHLCSWHIEQLDDIFKDFKTLEKDYLSFYRESYE